MNNLQTILVAVFLAFFVFAVLIFSGLIKLGDSGTSKTEPQGKIVIWGTFPNSPELIKVFEDTTEANKNLVISYVKKSEATYQQALIEAFANGTGPDLYFISGDMIKANNNFVYKIPYTSYPQKTFRDSFIDGADVFMAPDGVMGFPFAVDPMVMYYNKDLLSNVGIVSPPKFWHELFGLNASLTKKKDDGTILQSMIGLGRFDNVSHAKDILASLFLQNGNQIVKRTETGFAPVLNDFSSTSATSPVEAVLNFFVEFSNPSDQGYSWNRALPNSLDMFTGGKLALYLGRASELFTIESVNPNLSFDVTGIPQTQGSNTLRTYGKIYAVAVNKKSQNLSTAFSLAGILSTGDIAKNLAASLSLPPASRTLLASKPTDPYLFTFFNSAIISRTWIDPNSAGSDAVFGELIQNILSNKLDVSAAVNKAQGQLELLFKR